MPKSRPNSPQANKCINIHNKAQFGSPKHLHQATFETSKYLQQTMFEIPYLGENVLQLPDQKVAKNVAISLGYIVFLKKIGLNF